MNVIYCTDIHGSFTKVYNLLKETVADLYIISGDLIDMAFYSLDQSIEYYETQNMLFAMRREDNKGNTVLEEYVAQALEKDSINSFIKYRQQVEENMRAYLRVLGETADIRKSFDKYITRLKSMGITIPETIMKRIEMLLQKKI